MLTEILKDIKNCKEIAQMEVDPEKDHRVYHSKMGSKRKAKEDLERYFMEYKRGIQPMLLFIAVTGNGANKFAEMCEKNKWAFSYDAEDFYRDLVKDVDPVNWQNKPFGANMVDILTRRIEDKAEECDIMQYNMLLFDHKYSRHINNQDELIELFSEMFNEQIGVEFMGYDILNKMAIKGVEEEFDGTGMPILPIVVKAGKNPKLIDQILTHFPLVCQREAYLVAAGVGVPKECSAKAAAKIQKIDKENVVKVLKTINDMRQ